MYSYVTIGLYIDMDPIEFIVVSKNVIEKLTPEHVHYLKLNLILQKYGKPIQTLPLYIRWLWQS